MSVNVANSPCIIKFTREGYFVTDTVLISLFSYLGTLVGTLGGIIASGKLTGFRLEQLEKKVELHNNFAGRIPVIEEQIKVINHRIDNFVTEN